MKVKCGDDLKRCLLKLLLSISATSWMFIVYLIKAKTYLQINGVNETILKYGSYFIYAALPILLCYLAILLIEGQESDSLTGECVAIENANNVFLPSYLGYFFVSLSINSFDVMLVIYLIVLAFTYVSQNQYFNPGFLLLGYKFYFITTSNKVKVFLISKQDMRSNSATFGTLKRINDSSYFEVEEND